jgi:hypothetical protein
MWVNVFLLALAMNFEPTRIGLLPLFLAGDKPLNKMLAFLVGSMTASLSFGITILTTLEAKPFGDHINLGGWAQIALGASALAVSTVITSRWLITRFRNERPPNFLETTQKIDDLPRAIEPIKLMFITFRTMPSPWIAGLLGVGVGLPSADFVAVLAIIGSSELPASYQSVALVMFVVTGSLVILTPLLGLHFAPIKTRKMVTSFGNWFRSRHPFEYVGLLAIMGCVLIFLGLRDL